MHDIFRLFMEFWGLSKIRIRTHHILIGPDFTLALPDPILRP